MLRILKTFFVLMLFLVVGYSSFLMVHESLSYQECVANYQRNSFHPVIKNFSHIINIDAISTNVICVMRVIDKHSGTLVALATIILAIFTFFLWRSTHKLWIVTKKQSKDNQKSLFITKESSEATKKIVSTMEANARMQLRAYLSVAPLACVPQDKTTGWKHEVRMIIHNTGYTPAHTVNFSICARVMDFPLPDDFELSLPIQEHTAAGHIAHGQQFFIVASLEDFISDQKLEEIVKGNGQKLYVYGTVKYKDVFGEEHYTNFCQFGVWDVKGNFGTRNIFRHNDAS